MIRGDVMFFGYGDIACQATFQTLRYQEFLPPQKVGCNLTEVNVTYTGRYIEIHVTLDECRELKKKLMKVPETTNHVFEFKGTVYDFTNFNLKSVEAVLHAVDYVIASYLMCMAC